MKQLMRSLKVLSIFFVLISIFLLAGIVIQQNKSQTFLLQSSNENKESLRVRYATAGTIYSKDKVKLAYSEADQRHYASDPELARSLIQTIGDYTHNIGNTLEGAYQDRLIGSGRPWYKQFLLDVSGQGKKGDDLLLTLNSELNLAVQSQLDGFQGSIVIMNYQTGEILALVSTPNIYPENVINWENIPDTALFNRSFNAQYAPGSTYKIVTGAAWSNSPNYDPDYQMFCKGEEPLFGPGSVTENRGEGSHGEVDMANAYAVSCNHFFGDVGVKSGFDIMRETAEEFGFNQPLQIGKLFARTGVYEALDNDNYLLSWQSIGQPIDQNKLTVSPLHLAMISGAIANNGQMMQPYLVEGYLDPDGNLYEQTEKTVFSQLSDQTDIEAIKSDLIYTVTNGKSSGAYISGFTVGGKTGTAESMTEDGEMKTNSLYTGFIADPQYPYAIGIVVENGVYDTPSIAGELLFQTIEINP